MDVIFADAINIIGESRFCTVAQPGKNLLKVHGVLYIVEGHVGSICLGSSFFELTYFAHRGVRVFP